MKRETSHLATLGFLLWTLPLMFGQDPQTNQNPELPPDILGPQLIAWSQLQKPQPVQLPALDRPLQQADQQPANPRAQQEQPAAPTFVGTIIKNGSTYILKVSSNIAYELDDQDRAKQHEGQQVKITGTLDAAGKSLHITSIELVS